MGLKPNRRNHRKNSRNAALNQAHADNGNRFPGTGKTGSQGFRASVAEKTSPALISFTGQELLVS
jgi:hypothetical protein